MTRKGKTPEEEFDKEDIPGEKVLPKTVGEKVKSRKDEMTEAERLRYRRESIAKIEKAKAREQEVAKAERLKARQRDLARANEKKLRRKDAGRKQAKLPQKDKKKEKTIEEKQKKREEKVLPRTLADKIKSGSTEVYKHYSASHMWLSLVPPEELDILLNMDPLERQIRLGYYGSGARRNIIAETTHHDWAEGTGYAASHIGANEMLTDFKTYTIQELQNQEREQENRREEEKKKGPSHR